MQTARTSRWAALAVFAAGVALVATPFAVPAAPATVGDSGAARIDLVLSSPNTLYVDDDLGCEGNSPCYQRLQDAVDSADDGDVVSVAAGRYTETVTVIDKRLQLHGPAPVDPADADDPARHALWVARSPAPGTALAFVAATRDITGVRVSGFRFMSGTVGVALTANGHLTGPPTPATVVSDTVIAGNLFRGVGSAADDEGAVVARWANGLVIEQNVVETGGGLRLTGGSSVTVQANDFTNIGGDAVYVAAHGDSLTVRGNDIGPGAWHGIVVRPWSAVAPASVGRDITIASNVIEGSAVEAVVVDASTGGALQDVGIFGGSIRNAGTAAGGGTPVMGGIALWGGNGAALRDVRVELLTVEGTGSGSLGSHAGIHAQDVAGTLIVSGVNAFGNAGPGLRLLDTADVIVARSLITGNLDHAVRVVESRAVERIKGIRIGGNVADGNVLWPNQGEALALQNNTGSSVSTGDVDATFNDWGTAYASTIEDRVHHRADDILLGTVKFLPALGTPADAAAFADPPSLVADGSSESLVRLEATDLAGRPVANDALVRFRTVGGTLLDGGATVEAEGGAALRYGAWVTSTSLAFGPFSASGHIRTATPGSWLSWAFDEPAVLVRYGQTTLNTGVISATIDGTHVGTFSTVGMEKTWVDRLVGRDLGPGTHTISLTLISGEVNVDRLVAGSLTVNGMASVRLRSGTAVGFGRVTGAVHGATGPITANVDVAFTAGQPADLAMGVGDEAISVGGVTTTVTVTALDAQGRPVADGTPIDFTTTLGQIAPLHTTTLAGLAVAELTSELLVGTATVRAESGAAFVERNVEIVPGLPRTIIMNAEPRSLPANSHATSEVAIIVRDEWDNTVADGTTVAVVTSLGSVDPPNPVTSDGFAKTTLTSGEDAGVATVRGSSAGATGSVTVAMRATDLRIQKRSAPASSVVPGESVTFTLSYANVGNGDVYGVVIDDMLPQGLISPVVRTPPRQQITRLTDRPLGFRLDRVAPGQQGDIVVALKVDTSESWDTRSVITNHVTIVGTGAAELTPGDNAANASAVVVPGAVYNVELRVPAQVLVGGATGTVRVSLSDRYGNPAADGTPVSFATDIGSIEPSSGTTIGGSVTALFASDTRAGTATVTVTTLDERGAAATILITPGAAQQLDLTVGSERLVVGGASTVLTATLHDQYANPVPGDDVTFETTVGLLTVLEGVTNVKGQLTTTLRSSVLADTGIVVATSGALSDSKSVTFVPAAPAGLQLTLERARIRVGEVSRAVATVVDAFGNRVSGLSVAFESAVAAARPTAATTDADGQARTDLHGAKPGVGVVRASLGAIIDEQPLEVVAGSVYLPAAYR